MDPEDDPLKQQRTYYRYVRHHHQKLYKASATFCLLMQLFIGVRTYVNIFVTQSFIKLTESTTRGGRKLKSWIWKPACATASLSLATPFPLGLPFFPLVGSIFFYNVHPLASRWIGSREREVQGYIRRTWPDLRWNVWLLRANLSSPPPPVFLSFSHGSYATTCFIGPSSQLFFVFIQCFWSALMMSVRHPNDVTFYSRFLRTLRLPWIKIYTQCVS